VIIGRVTERDEASVPLILLDEYDLPVKVDVLVDTGFTGYLALSNDVVQQLQLPQVDEEEVDLADSSTTVLALYKVTVMWHDEPNTLTAYAVAGRSLIGMKLLRGSLVTLEVIEDGTVMIEPAE
jgi:clan AA aspartic protease